MDREEQWMDWLIARCEEEMGEMVDNGFMTDRSMDLAMDDLMGTESLDQLESKVEALGLHSSVPEGDC